VRVWDLSPGYLNRQSLLAEHRELHGHATAADLAAAKEGASQMLLRTQALATQRGEAFLLSSTAPSDLAAFLDVPGAATR
jgi:hypothetical protein